MEDDVMTLIKELTQGKELARQLCHHLLSSASASASLSNETNEFLIQKILCSYDKALQMLNSQENAINGSPRSEVLDHEHNKHTHVFKKRKSMPRWTEQVKICTETGLEGSSSLDDGYSWRKYGQKDILGAKFPRGYYRCSHRHGQGCLATKQVQKSDEDPTVFEVTYRGRHTCNNQAFSLNKVSSSKKKMGFPQNHHHHHQSYQPQEQEEKLEYSLDTFFTFGSELQVKMDDIFPSFGHNLQAPESDVTEIVSAPTSLTNSSLVDLDLLLDKENFQTYSPFNTSEFFSS